LKRLEIVQIGLGHVGRAVAQIVLEERTGASATASR
jgi:hypothetical protein